MRWKRRSTEQKISSESPTGWRTSFKRSNGCCRNNHYSQRTRYLSMLEEFKTIPSKVPIEQFDVGTFSKEKIRDLFRSGKLPTAEAMVDEIILRAAKEGATDLHIEPAENELRIRIGREGVMKRLVYLPKEIS